MNWLTTAGIWGALAIGIGAFGAHGLPGYLEAAGHAPAEVAKRLGTLNTGAQYQMYTALALLAIGLARSAAAGRTLDVAGWLLLGGSAMFSGLLYAIALLSDDYRWLGAIVPIGGVAMIAGWALIAVAGLQRRVDQSPPPEG